MKIAVAVSNWRGDSSSFIDFNKPPNFLGVKFLMTLLISAFVSPVESWAITPKISWGESELVTKFLPSF